MKYIKDKDELLEHLRQQVNFLILSSKTYDSGDGDEAIRLATHTRVLVHNSGPSSALLNQLHILDHLLFFNSSSVNDPRNIGPFNGLTLLRVSSEDGKSTSVSFTLDLKTNKVIHNQNSGEKSDSVSYVARLDDLPPSGINNKMGFTRWWEREIVIRDGIGNVFTRKNLIRTVCDKEGGAHVDPTLDEAYAKLSRFNSMGWKVHQEDVEKDFQNTPVMPSVRQIVHELLKTLKENFKQIFPEGDRILQQFKDYEEHCKIMSKHRKIG